MKTLWQRWLGLGEAPVDVRPYALVRICIAAVVVVDLLQLWCRGLVPVLFAPPEAGGIAMTSDPFYVFGPGAGPTLWLMVVLCFVCVGVGVLPRVTGLVGIVLYAQLGHLYPQGDMAVDRIMRFATLVLLPSGAFSAWVVWPRPRIPMRTIRRWTDLVLRSWLVVIYLSAGIAKLADDVGWVSWPRFPPVYRILTDPMAGYLDPATWSAYTGLFALMSWATIALELSAPLILTRWAPLWAIAGAGLHLGIAATMKLGSFSWGMLALYPILFARWLDADARAADWRALTGASP